MKEGERGEGPKDSNLQDVRNQDISDINGKIYVCIRHVRMNFIVLRVAMLTNALNVLLRIYSYLM